MSKELNPAIPKGLPERNSEARARRTRGATQAEGFDRPLPAGGVVVLLGVTSEEPTSLDTLVREFGWTFESAENLDRLRSLSVERNVVAVFFEPAALEMPW